MKPRFPSDMHARIQTLERQLAAARQENAALKLARDAALRVATWGGIRRTEPAPSPPVTRLYKDTSLC